MTASSRPLHKGGRPEAPSFRWGRVHALLADMRATLPQWRETDDHIFHEVTDISLTEAVPTDPRGIDAFIEEVSATQWDEDWKPVFYDEMVANYVAASGAEGLDP